MNFEDKKTLYDEAQKSLQKFKGKTCEGHPPTTLIQIKLEPQFLAEKSTDAAGYARMRRNKFYRDGEEVDRCGEEDFRVPEEETYIEVSMKDNHEQAAQHLKRARINQDKT